MGVSNLTAEQETDTGRIIRFFTFQQGTGHGHGCEEVVVAVNGATQLDRTVEVLRSLFGGNHREGGTVTVLGRHTALNQLHLLDGGHRDTAATAHAHTIDDSLLTVGTVTTDTRHGTIHRGDTLHVGQSACHRTTRRRTDAFTGHTVSRSRSILREHRRFPFDHDFNEVVCEVKNEVFEHDLVGTHRDVLLRRLLADHHCICLQIVRSGVKIRNRVLTIRIGLTHAHDTVTNL